MNDQNKMVALVEEYLALRRGMGYALHIEGAELLRFARYADEKGHHSAITTELAMEWARLPKQAERLYWARRLDIVRRFAKHRRLFDPHTEIPAEGAFGPSYRRPQPHIYSDDAIRQLIQQASLLGPAGGLRSKTYQTLFGLLACTGLRISEALHLRRDDVDVQRGLMTITATKYKKTRLVPLHPSATQALKRYSQKRDQYHLHPRAETFFLTEHGTSLKYWRVLMTFIALRQQLGWEAKSRPFPTIHGLRHSFVVSRIVHWYREGVDLDRRIAALSTYLGHVKVTDTYWYVTATPELLSLSTERFEQFAKKASGGAV
jgi:integrase